MANIKSNNKLLSQVASQLYVVATNVEVVTSHASDFPFQASFLAMIESIIPIKK